MSSPNSAEVSGSPSPAPSSIGNNAPKYGTLVPNRVFVGGISASTTEQDLLELFSQYGAVKATKIISDRAGVSKGYGFVTFETEEEARRLTQEADNIMLKDRKLNIAPAIKKQVSDVGYMKTYSPHLIESSSNVMGSGGTVFYSNGTTYATYGNTVPVLAPTEYHATFPQAPAAPTTPTAYPSLVYPQPVYYPHQYQYQPTQTVQPQWGAASQWRWMSPISYAQPECGPQQCLVEASSPAQGELATASAPGSSPLTSTPITLACPSTPTTATTTTAVCTAVTTTSSTSAKTTATSTSTVTKTVKTHDSLLQIKPLSVATKCTSTSGKSKCIPTVVPKTTLPLDKNNNAVEVRY
nr:protein boule-like [Cherax quadricarinatus]